MLVEGAAKTLRVTLAVAMVNVALPASAALFDRGGGMIYDDAFNITWLADANYAKTSGYNADGLMNWFEARDWASQLVYGGYDDWRLPSAWNRDGSVPTYGFYRNGSELGHLFYDELAGNNFGFNGTPLLTDNTNPNLALFTNIMDSGPNPYWAGYWSGTLKSDTPFWTDPDGAWMMLSGGSGAPGLQALTDKENVLVGESIYAWAVRDGDVAAVPEPATLALLGIALAGLGFSRRQRIAD